MIIFQTIYNVVTCISFDNLSISYRLQTWMLCSTLFPQVETTKIQEIFLPNRRHQTTSVSFRNLGYFWYFQYLSFRYWNLRYKLLPLRNLILERNVLVLKIRVTWNICVQSPLDYKTPDNWIRKALFIRSLASFMDVTSFTKLRSVCPP